MMPTERADGTRPPSSLGHRGGDGKYVPNRLDPLDIAIAQILNDSLPPQVYCTRIDQPLTLAQAGQCEVLTARYQFNVPGGTGLYDHKPVMCKLVDKVGPRAVKGEKKVLVRVSTGWHEFEAYVISLLAA